MPAETKYDNVASKLYEPTTAYQAQKFKKDSDDEPKNIKKIGDDSHLLSHTTAYSSMKTIKLADRLDDEGSVKIPKPIQPDSHLLAPTNALLTGAYRSKDAEAEEAARLAAARLNAPIRLSEHLLEPTAAMISSRKALVEKNDSEKNVEDDIWNINANPKLEVLERIQDPYANTVSSKLMEENTAYAAYKTEKYEKKSGTYGPVPVVKPISKESHVLTETFAVKNGAWETSYIEEPVVPVSEARLLSQKTGPKDVESRLYEPTTAIKNGQWKPKEIREAEEELKIEEEESSKGEKKYVMRTSERLLEPTHALENGRYVKKVETDPREAGWKPAAGPVRIGSVSSDDGSLGSNSLKVKEPSARLLEPTAGLENARWRGSTGYIPWSDKEKDQEIALSEHLLAPTQANEYGRYSKEAAEVDEREVGWKPAPPKPPQDLFELKDPVPEFLNPNFKVATASERLTTLTVALENGKWKGPSEKSESLSPEDDAKKPLNIKPVTSTEHFLSPTTATINGAFKQPDPKPEPPKIVKEPSARLLTPTMNNHLDNWKNQVKQPTPEQIEEMANEVRKVPNVKKVTNTEHFLTPTSATINGQAKPVLRRLSSSEKVPVDEPDRRASIETGTKDVSVKNLVRRFSNRGSAVV